jgi:hypothetical protein
MLFFGFHHGPTLPSPEVLSDALAFLRSAPPVPPHAAHTRLTTNGSLHLKHFRFPPCIDSSFARSFLGRTRFFPKRAPRPPGAAHTRLTTDGSLSLRRFRSSPRAKRKGEEESQGAPSRAHCPVPASLRVLPTYQLHAANNRVRVGSKKGARCSQHAEVFSDAHAFPRSAPLVPPGAAHTRLTTNGSLSLKHFRFSPCIDPSFARNFLGRARFFPKRAPRPPRAAHTRLTTDGSLSLRRFRFPPRAKCKGEEESQGAPSRAHCPVPASLRVLSTYQLHVENNWCCCCSSGRALTGARKKGAHT